MNTYCFVDKNWTERVTYRASHHRWTVWNRPAQVVDQSAAWNKQSNCVYNPTGACHCQILDCVLPGSVDMSKVKFDAKSEDDCRHNFSLLREAFSENKITTVCTVGSDFFHPVCKNGLKTMLRYSWTMKRSMPMFFFCLCASDCVLVIAELDYIKQHIVAWLPEVPTGCLAVTQSRQRWKLLLPTDKPRT